MNKSILVVEDEPALQKAIQKKLKLSGFNVLCANSVKEALGHLAEHTRVDAIWLDHYLLGEKNGLDLVHELKRDGSAWKDIPIFVVSNTASNDKIRSYKLLGITQYYTKSDIALSDILREIKQALV